MGVLVVKAPATATNDSEQEVDFPTNGGHSVKGVYSPFGGPSMARSRRTYTPEFKAQAVKLVTEQGYSVAEAARSLGLSDNLLRNWKQALLDQGEHAFLGQ